MNLLFRIVQICLLAGGLVLQAQQRNDQLPPSNLDPAPAAAPQEYHEPRPAKKAEPEKKNPFANLVDPSDPKFYAKLGLLLGSILLARKAFRQMRSS